jgi:hypothetical protein
MLLTENMPSETMPGGADVNGSNHVSSNGNGANDVRHNGGLEGAGGGVDGGVDGGVGFASWLR